LLRPFPLPAPAAPGKPSPPLPGLRPGVVLVGSGEESELRDLQIGQIVRLGEVAAVVVTLLDGTRDAEALLRAAAEALGEEINPVGLVDLLQALDRRALLDTPRARMVVAQGLVRADLAALQKLARRVKPLRPLPADATPPSSVRIAPDTGWSCRSCARCCSEHHLLGPVTKQERDAILAGFDGLSERKLADGANFLLLPTGDERELYLIRPRDGFCPYLDQADGRCVVHARLGEDVKPAVCRMFPFHVTRTPDGWDAGLSLTCPTVARGDGPDPTPEVQAIVSKLPVFHRLVHDAPQVVALDDGVRVPWSDYRAWENEALKVIGDTGRPVGEAWLGAVRALAARIHAEHDPPVGAETTSELRVLGASTETAPSALVPEWGVGEPATDATGGADVFLRDLAFWLELLVGLEAADPAALRRFRSALLRLRASGTGRDAAPVLAELARLAHREADIDDVLELDEEPITESHVVRPVPPPPSNDALARRFLSQALLDRRLLEYGTVARGAALLTALLGALRLSRIDGDEMHCHVGDVAYLVHHPQVADIVDTRATVRAYAADPRFHAAILGLPAG
jgi:Fe-S-cluster containining protein